MIKKNISNIFKFIVFFVFLFCPSRMVLRAQGDAHIMPGVGVGVIRLGDRFMNIKQSMVQARTPNLRKVDSQRGDEIWISYNELGMTLVYGYETKILERIMILTEGLLVENTGIHVGSKESEVLKFLGNPGIRNRTDQSYELDYPHLGIKFYVKTEDQRVYMIEVKRKKIPQN